MRFSRLIAGWQRQPQNLPLALLKTPGTPFFDPMGRANRRMNETECELDFLAIRARAAHRLVGLHPASRRHRPRRSFMRTFGMDEPMGCYDDFEAADAFVEAIAGVILSALSFMPAHAGGS